MTSLAGPSVHELLHSPKELMEAPEGRPAVEMTPSPNSRADGSGLFGLP